MIYLKSNVNNEVKITNLLISFIVYTIIKLNFRINKLIGDCINNVLRH